MFAKLKKEMERVFDSYMLDENILKEREKICLKFGKGNKIDNLMMSLKELIEKNKHKLIRYNEGIVGHRYMKVFDYSKKYGGTFDSFKYYNNYYVDVTENT